MDNNCFICDNCDKELVESESVLVKAKGIATLINSSKQRLDNKWTMLTDLEFIRVHAVCRKNYTRPDTIKKCANEQNETTMLSPTKGKLRSTCIFNFKDNCLFCNNECSKECELKKSKERRDFIFNVSTLHFKQSIEDVAKIRNDEWGKTVLKRLSSC